MFAAMRTHFGSASRAAASADSFHLFRRPSAPGILHGQRNRSPYRDIAVNRHTGEVSVISTAAAFDQIGFPQFLVLEDEGLKSPRRARSHAHKLLPTRLAAAVDRLPFLHAGCEILFKSQTLRVERIGAGSSLAGGGAASPNKSTGVFVVVVGYTFLGHKSDPYGSRKRPAAQWSAVSVWVSRRGRGIRAASHPKQGGRLRLPHHNRQVHIPYCPPADPPIGSSFPRCPPTSAARRLRRFACVGTWQRRHVARCTRSPVHAARATI